MGSRQPALELDLQYAIDSATAQRCAVPDAAVLRRWLRLALQGGGYRRATTVTLRLVDEEEIATLNQHYRGKAGATNILTFPFEPPPGVRLPLLGDIIIAAPVVLAEATAQQKPIADHWAHLLIHGTLHLLGYDHIEPAAAEQMEQLERELLAQLGIADPYATDQPLDHDGE